VRRNTLIVILLSSVAGALRSQPVLPPQITHTQPSIQAAPAQNNPRNRVTPATGRLEGSDGSKRRELLALLQRDIVAENACEAPLRPPLLPQR
jgi:hypothetical protein